MDKKSKGTVVVYILVAIALFSALAFAMFRSSQNTGSFDTARNRLLAAEIDGYMDAVEKAVDVVRSRNGCSDNQISFDNDKETSYQNPFAPTDGSCNIFSKDGGRINWRSAKIDGVDNKYIFSGFYAIQTGTGPEDGDLIVILPGITKKLCMFYNNKEKYFKYPAIPREVTLSMPFSPAKYFKGVYVDYPFNCNDGADPTAACALTSIKYDHLCVAGNDSSTFYIYNFIHYRPKPPPTAN